MRNYLIPIGDAKIMQLHCVSENMSTFLFLQ